VRIVFEVAPDFSKSGGGWKEMLRVWVCALCCRPVLAVRK
jgi:hypothetical protein